MAAAVLLIVAGIFLFRNSTSHRSAVRPSTTTTTSPTTTTAPTQGSAIVPNIVGLSQAAATAALAQAGLTVGAISGSSSQLPAGTVIASNPSAGGSVDRGSVVSLTVSSGPATTSASRPPSSSPGGPSGSSAGGAASPSTASPPSPSTAATTPSGQSNCPSGNVAYTESSETGSVCVKVGSTLTVTFVSTGGRSGYGQWNSSPPTISDNSVLQGGLYRSSGKTATATFSVVGAGTATVTAQFDVTCAPADTTPCTVPPEALQFLTVTVDPA